jgi:threonine/homoserine/homoserine lactone efflux protein
MGPIGGVLVAIGHTIFELPYVLLLSRTSSNIERSLARVRKPLSAAIAVFIVYFAAGLFKSPDQIGLSGGSVLGHGPIYAILTGLVLTAFNPHFLLWWVTVGFPIVTDEGLKSARGFTICYAAHVWMDYVWLTLLALGGASLKLLGSTIYRVFLAALGLVLLVFAADIILRGFTRRRILPF